MAAVEVRLRAPAVARLDLLVVDRDDLVDEAKRRLLRDARQQLRGREQRSERRSSLHLPAAAAAARVRVVAVGDVAEQAGLRALDRVDLLAVDQQPRVADRDRRAALLAAPRSAARRSPCAPAGRAAGSDRRTRPRPRRARARSRGPPPSCRRSRAAARRRRARGSPAAPDRPGSGSGRTSRRAARRARRRCARGCPSREISSTRSSISIGGSGRRVVEALGRVLDQVSVREGEQLLLLEGRARAEVGVLHAGVSEAHQVARPGEPRADPDHGHVVARPPLLPVHREHGGRAGRAGVAEPLDVRCGGARGRCRSARRSPRACAGSPDGRRSGACARRSRSSRAGARSSARTPGSRRPAPCGPPARSGRCAAPPPCSPAEGREASVLPSSCARPGTRVETTAAAAASPQSTAALRSV